MGVVCSGNAGFGYSLKGIFAGGLSRLSMVAY